MNTETSGSVPGSAGENVFEKNIMSKKIVLCVLCLVVGCVLGVVLSMAYCGHKISKAMFLLQEKEIITFGGAALDAYYNQPNEVAVWALETHVKMLNTVKEERSPAKVNDPYLLLSPDTDLALAHIRLGKLYKQMGNAEKSRYNFERAMSISKNTKSPTCPALRSLNTEEDCLRALDILDKSRNKQE